MTVTIMTQKKHYVIFILAMILLSSSLVSATSVYLNDYSANNNYPDSLTVSGNLTKTITVGRTGLSDLTANFEDYYTTYNNGTGILLDNNVFSIDTLYLSQFNNSQYVISLLNNYYDKNSSDIRYLKNESLFLNENGTIWIAINEKVNQSTLAQDFLNYYIKNEVYNKSEINNTFAQYYTSNQTNNLISNFINGNGTNLTIPMWAGNKVLIDSPLQIVYEPNEQYFSLYNKGIYYDYNNEVGGINVPTPESHQATWSVNSNWQTGVGNITSGAYDIIDNVTIVTIDDLLVMKTLSDASRIQENSIKHYVVNIIDNNHVNIEGNWTNENSFNTNVWSYKQASYLDVNGESTGERGVSISSDGKWAWSMFVGHSVNDSKLCFASSNDAKNKMCIDNQGNLYVKGSINSNINFVGGVGTNQTVPLWSSNNTLSDSPITIVTDNNLEKYLGVYDNILRVDKDHQVVSINTPINESHSTTLTVSTNWNNGVGIITSSYFNSTLNYTVINIPELQNIPTISSGAKLKDNNGVEHHIYSAFGTTLYIAGNFTNENRINTTNWTFKQSPYITINGNPDEERGYSWASNGQYQWVAYIPYDSNNNELCFASGDFGNNLCMNKNGDVHVLGTLYASSLDVTNTSTDHNLLANIQGGLSNEHYHLSLADYNSIINKSWLSINTTNNIKNLGFNTTIELNSLFALNNNVCYSNGTGCRIDSGWTSNSTQSITNRSDIQIPNGNLLVQAGNVNPAIYGRTYISNGVGVQGYSYQGTGLSGLVATGTGVEAISYGGNALHATSSTGNAGLFDGNVTINGALLKANNVCYSNGTGCIAIANGTNGLNGTNGINGQSSNMSIINNGDGTYTWKLYYTNGTNYANFTTSNLTGIQGTQGVQGIQGIAGINGSNASVTSSNNYIIVNNGAISFNTTKNFINNTDGDSYLYMSDAHTILFNETKLNNTVDNIIYKTFPSLDYVGLVETQISTTSNTIWSPITALTYTMSANAHYSIKCDVVQDAAAATTGVQLRVNTSGTPTAVQFTFTKMSSTSTMETFTGTNVTTNTFASTGSSTTASVGTLTGIVLTGANPSTFTVDMHSEISGSASRIEPSTVCSIVRIA